MGTAKAMHGGGTPRVPEGRGGRSVDPAVALSVAEAASLAGRPEAEIEGQIASGVLLSESQRKDGKDVQIIRAIDLLEAYPEAFAEPALPKEAPGGPAPNFGAAFSPVLETSPYSTPGGDDPEAHQVGGHSGGQADSLSESHGEALSGGPESVVEAVRTSGTSRDALIELCQDMETRLDLAERERQASTAALLMAQRRVLDLEVQLRKQPWARAGGIFAAIASAAAVFIALRAPGAAREAAANEIAPLRESAIEGIRKAGESLATQWEGQWQSALDAERTSADQERARFGETLRAAESSAQMSAKAVQDLAATSAATLAKVKAESQGVLDAAQTERIEAARERKELLIALDDLERRLGSSEETARKRSAELEVAHDNAGRDRMRFRERLGDAERILEDARLAMGASRRAQADDRERLRQTTERLEAALAKVEARGRAQAASSPLPGAGSALPAGPAKRPMTAPPTQGSGTESASPKGRDSDAGAVPSEGGGTDAGANGGADGPTPHEETREGSAKPGLSSILRALFG